MEHPRASLLQKHKRLVLISMTISRLSAVRDNDYILMYVRGKKELRGLWKAEGRAFYDETPVWEDKIYPLRCKIKCSEFRFTNSLKLNDIRDLQNMG